MLTDGRDTFTEVIPIRTEGLHRRTEMFHRLTEMDFMLTEICFKRFFLGFGQAFLAKFFFSEGIVEYVYVDICLANIGCGSVIHFLQPISLLTTNRGLHLFIFAPPAAVVGLANSQLSLNRIFSLA